MKKVTAYHSTRTGLRATRRPPRFEPGELVCFGARLPRWLRAKFQDVPFSGLLVVDPTRRALFDAVSTSLQKLLKRCKVRLIAAADVDLEPVLQHPAGAVSSWGCKGLRYHDTGATSPACTDLDVTWATLHGRRIVRIAAFRGRVHHNPNKYERLWLPSPEDPDEMFEARRRVFPERAAEALHVRLARTRRILETFGPQGDDDRLSLFRPELVAWAPGFGTIITDGRARPAVVQVVVRDPATGHRHHILVPPRFGRPESKTWQRLGLDRARVRAAVAWTFGMRPNEYTPDVEA